MSKQSEAKEKQQYVDKFEPSVCGNCSSMASEKTTIKHAFGSYEKESMLRCKIGGFKVKKMGSCTEWSGKASGDGAKMTVEKTDETTIQT